MNEARHDPRGVRGVCARLLALTLGLAVSMSPLAASASPVAGTTIDNTASGAGADSASGIPLAAISNLVRAIVQPLEALTLNADQSILATPGQVVTLAHRLTNTGNFSDDFRLDYANAASNSFDLASLALYLDRNRNGLVDAGDLALATGSALTLAPDSSADLLMSGQVPLAAVAGTAAALEITATGLAQALVALNTDSVRVTPALVAPALAFYASPAFAATTRIGRRGDPLFVEADAPACDLNPATPDSVTITLLSELTGDQESFRAAETAAGSGRFRILPNVATVDGGLGSVVSGDGRLAVLRNDVVVASLLGCGSVRTEARLWIEPAGVAFDSRSDQLLAGVRVSLLDVLGDGNGGQPGGPAAVYLPDGVTPASNAVVTDAAGRFSFPWVKPSTYRLLVSPITGYHFPSSRAPAALPLGHVIDAAASYGGDFAIADPGSPVRSDLPLDAAATSALFAEKTASSSFVEVGDGLGYTVSVANPSDSTLAAVTLEDALPAGFAFVPGSARRDTSKLADPAGGRGPHLTFALGSLAAGATATLRYRVSVGPGALDGDGVNRAVAISGAEISNTATVKVSVLGGVFAEEATLLGTVFVDRNGDGRRESGEPGLPGVRLYLDDGTFAITDSDGQYSLYGLPPRTHALAVDRTTLPPGARLETRDARDRDTPGLRFVDLTRGDLLRADFAVAGDSLTLHAALERHAQSVARSSEIARGVHQSLPLAEDPRPAGDARARPSEGVVSGEARLPLFEDRAHSSDLAGTSTSTPRSGIELAPAAAALLAITPESETGSSSGGMGDERGDSAPDSTRAAEPGSAKADLDRWMTALDPAPGFLGLANGDTLATDQIAVRVKGHLGEALELVVNGEPVPASRVGRKLSVASTGVEVWEYLGVRLSAGSNHLEVREPDGQGGSASVNVIAPDRLSRIMLEMPAGIAADGHSAASVRVRLADPHGVPITQRTLVTLESSLGRWQTPDLDPASPGLQIAVEGGEGVVELAAPREPGRAVVTAAAGETRDQATLDFVPELRPLLMLGTVEGVITLDRLRHGALAPPTSHTGFETPITGFLSERRDGEASAAAHAALFVKGRVRDDLLLTLGYDSDRPAGLRRFRDIQPDAYYPIYGDASTRGYEAQSTGRLYARLDRRGASLLYGDFVTQSAGSERSLAAYSRSLNGVQEHYEDRRLRLDAFTSRDRTGRRVDELPGLGISGPYQLRVAPFVENSERVEIVTRDRNQPSVVLRAVPLTRFTDYEIEPLTGRLTFKSPVPSLDPDLNPMSVRVSYEVDQGGPAFWVSGAEARVRVHPKIELGGSYVDDHSPEDTNQLRSAFVGVELAPGSVLEGEFALTHRPGLGDGEGGRFELRHQADGVNVRLFGAATSTAFSNPNSGFAAGRSEAGGNLTARLAERTTLHAEALFSADALGAQRRGGLLLGVQHTLNDALRGELGVRLAGESRQSGTATPATEALRGRLLAQLPRHPEFSAYGELEQDVRDARRMAALGGEYRFSARGKLYARHELISSLTGPFNLDASERRLSTNFGVDTELPGDSHLFSEYRLGGTISGREAEAAVGLRNGWRLADGLRVNTSFERVSPLLGSSTGPTMAVTGALEYVEDEQWKASYRVEARTGRASDGFLSTLAAAGALDRDWTMLVRNLVTLEDQHSSGDHVRQRTQFGFAYRRPDVEAWTALARYELHYDRDVPQAGLAERRIANVISIHATGRAAPRLTAALSWAGKAVNQRADGIVSGSGAQWLHGRGTLAIAEDWDAAFTASTLVGRGLTEKRYGLGIEAGRALNGGVWLSAGFNRFGYSDQDLPEEEYTRQGGYLRLRARFDQDLLLGRRHTP